MKLFFSAILCCCFLFSCVGSQSTAVQKDVEGDTPSENLLHNIVDSLFRVYPRAMENPIQKTDFIEALGESVKGLSAENISLLVEQIPFKLYQVQNVPNQPEGKYLVAFEYDWSGITEAKSVGDGYATLGDGYSIKVYGFAALDKDVAAQLVKYVEYKLSGDVEMIEEPSFWGWHNDQINIGFKVINASVAEIQ